MKTSIIAGVIGSRMVISNLGSGGADITTAMIYIASLLLFGVILILIVCYLDRRNKNSSEE